jgi:hypothetical protein
MQPIDPNAQPPYYPPSPFDVPLVAPLEVPVAPRFPSGAEIAGAIALLVPFAVSVSSGSVETENGHVTHWSYSNPIETIGGLVAIVCALFAIGAIRRSTGARRATHALAVLALVGLGVVRILHGSGTIGGPSLASAAPAPPEVDEATVHRLEAAAKAAAPPDAAPAPAIDPALDKAARRVLEQWRAGDARGIYADADPAFQTYGTVGYTTTLTESARELGGEIQGIAPLVDAGADGNDVRVVKSALTYARGPFPIELRFRIAGGAPRLVGFDLTVPGDLARTPDIAEAERIARRAAERIVKGEFAELGDDLDPRVPTDAASTKKMRDVLAEFGAHPSLKEAEHGACDDDQCFKFAVAGADTGSLSITMRFEFTRWRLIHLDAHSD